MKRHFLTALCGTLCLLTNAACDDGSDEPGSAAANVTEFEHSDKLKLTLAQSPSGGGEFTYCSTAKTKPKVSLSNAAWLGYMAANSYGNFGYLAGPLKELGFYNADKPEADSLWKQCALDLQALKKLESGKSSEMKRLQEGGPSKLQAFAKTAATSLGPCAKRWLATSEYDGKSYPSAAFEQSLLQEPDPTRYVEFFSAGEISEDGKTFEEGSTQVVFARHSTERIVVIAFRGTEENDPADLVVDSYGLKVPLKGDSADPPAWGEVHEGFNFAYESVEDQLMEKVRQLKNDNVGIWITGHSLGGALANLMASRILREMDKGAHYDFRGVYTFGSPRVGTQKFATELEEAADKHGVALVRFRNHNDRVTKLPAAEYGYAHAGELAYLTEKKIKLPWGEPKYDGRGSIDDHDMAGYKADGTPTTGYYSRMLDLLKNPKLDDDYTYCPED